jgi:PhnB protein
VQDPFGHVWHLATHVEDLSAAQMRKRAKEAAKT